MSGVRLREGELAALIRLTETGPTRCVSIDWKVGGSELRDIPENDWAMREVAKMRGIALSPADTESQS